LFVSDYAGHLTSFALNEQSGNYSLTQISQSNDCAPNPSWLTLDANRGILYCLNEGLETPNGSLNSFKINLDGSLTHVKSATALSGPVYAVLYGPAAGPRAIALAHYAGSGVSTWLLDGDHGGFSLNENVAFTLLHPGPDAVRQEAPHEHQAILDPTGQYILIPDLGADLIRVFSYNRETLKLKPLSPLRVAPGSGPRHVAFWNPYGVACDGCTTYLYLVAELTSTVTSYAVEYLPEAAGLKFTQIQQLTTYGPLGLPPGNAPAGIQITPDNRFLLISNRNNTSFYLPEPDGTIVPSDSLSTFHLGVSNGKLEFVQLWPSGGMFPRHFDLNTAGNLVAVGNQNSQNVVILARDVVTGLIGEPLARVTIGGNTTCMVF
ncbi:hypothetical protein M433DRAFT_50668, partial [Acidomyces richmondensis BFW]